MRFFLCKSVWQDLISEGLLHLSKKIPTIRIIRDKIPTFSVDLIGCWTVPQTIFFLLLPYYKRVKQMTLVGHQKIMLVRAMWERARTTRCIIDQLLIFDLVDLYSPIQPSTAQYSPVKSCTPHYSSVQPSCGPVAAHYIPVQPVILVNVVKYVTQLPFQKPHSLLCLVTICFRGY